MNDQTAIATLAADKLGSFNRRSFLKTAGLFAGAAALAPAVSRASTTYSGTTRKKPAIKYNHHLRTTPETSVDGYFSAEQPPALKVKSGEVVLYDTVNVSGIARGTPEEFLIENKIPMDSPVVQEIIAIRKEVPYSGVRGHLLTGPVYVEEAEPGDILEVRVLDLEIRTPYGVNSGRPGGGGLPDIVQEGWRTCIWFNKEKTHALFDDKIRIPLNPFFGVMGVAPAPGSGKLSSIPPYMNMAGNLDNRHLGIGSTLFMPVNTKGALFQAGDGHSVQGNGEVSGTAIETSLTGVMQFIVHKGKPTLKYPLGETATHYIVHGIDNELSMAMRSALRESCNFLTEHYGLPFNRALSLCSTVVDFEITQVVNGAKGIHGMIPKSIFTEKKPYWYSA